jgi:antitoxin component YwqK of YwqJK toxin-antitoxin module
MKALFIALFVSLLLFGCGSPDLDDPKTLDGIIAQAIDEDKLQKRGKEGEELFYVPNTQTPYTGWKKKLYKNGQVEELSHFKDGKLEGVVTVWHENGQKKVEINCKDGKLEGFGASWYENGEKKSEGNFKDGKLVTVTRWTPKGEKCPITNVVGGNGVVVDYNEDGTEKERTEIKNGEKVND